MEEPVITNASIKRESDKQAFASFEVQHGLRRRRGIGAVFFGLLTLVFAVFAAMASGWMPRADFLVYLGTVGEPGVAVACGLMTTGVAAALVWQRQRCGEVSSEDMKGFTLWRGNRPVTRLEWREIAEVQVKSNTLNVINQAGQSKLTIPGPLNGNALVGRIVTRFWSRLPAPDLPATCAPARSELLLGAAAAVLVVVVPLGWTWHGLISGREKFLLSPAPEQHQVWFSLLAYTSTATVMVVGCMLYAIHWIIVRVTLHPDRIEIQHPFRKSVWRFEDIDSIEADGALAVLVAGRRRQRLVMAFCSSEQQSKLTRAVFAVLGRLGATTTQQTQTAAL